MLDREGATCLVAVDRGIATVGGVSVVFSATAILHSVSLPPLQSDMNNQTVYSRKWWQTYDNGFVLDLPGHGLDLQALLYAVGQGLLVVVFTNTGQHSLLVGFILITAGVNFA